MYIFNRFYDSFIVFTLVVSFVIAPGADIVKANELSIDKSLGELNGIEVIYDSEEKSIYRVTEEDGLTYEYVEEVEVQDDSIEKIVQKKFIVKEDNSTTLVDTMTIGLEKTDSELIIENLSDNNATEVIINEDSFQAEQKVINPLPINPKGISSMAVSRQTASGGSYIADIRWYEYSDGKAHAVSGGSKTKYVSKTQWQYRDFRAAANNIKSEERNIITGGLAGVADAVWAAVKKGNMLSWTLIKKIFGQFGKAVPVVGTIIIVYNYVKACSTAKSLFKKIPA